MNNKKLLLYIGNKLALQGKTPTSIDTLAPQLESLVNVLTTSEKANPIMRFIDMIITLLKVRKKVDFILIDTYSTNNFYYAVCIAWIAIKLKIPYFPFLHGGNLPYRLENSPRLSKFLFTNAKQNITPSHFLEEAFKNAGYSTHFIPNNIELDYYTFKARGTTKPSLFFVRAFSAIYNPLMAIDGLELVVSKYPDARLCMVGPDKGDGTYQEVERAINQRSLSQVVSLKGILPKKEWIALSEEFDFFINTTNFDNLPVSLIEAMALGMIIISTNVGGIPFLIEDGIDGFLVDKEDSEAMSKKIITLLKDPELCSRVSHNARRKAETFGWASVALKWDNLLNGEL